MSLLKYPTGKGTQVTTCKDNVKAKEMKVSLFTVSGFSPYSVGLKMGTVALLGTAQS